MKKWIDRGVNLYEFFIAYLFLKGSWDVFHAEEVVNGGLVDYLTTREAIILYAVALGIQGLLLIVSKVFKRRKIHGHVLMSMYLLAFYIVALSLIVEGWDKGMIVSIFYTLSIGLLYLYWRYKVRFDKLDHKIVVE